MGALASCLLCDRIAGALQAQDGGSPPPRGLPLRFCILSRDGKSAPAPALYKVWMRARTLIHRQGVEHGC